MDNELPPENKEQEEFIKKILDDIKERNYSFKQAKVLWNFGLATFGLFSKHVSKDFKNAE